MTGRIRFRISSVLFVALSVMGRDDHIGGSERQTDHEESDYTSEKTRPNLKRSIAETSSYG